jgi:phage terminase Nu1 subunit (DNA packaging protein)
MARAQIEVVAGDFDMAQDAAAVLAGVSVQSLILWDKQPNPPPRNADKSYPAKAFGAWLVEFRGAKRAGRPRADGGEGSNKSEAETRLRVAQAEKVERENREAEGELINVATVESAWQEILMRVRTRLLQLPSKLAPVIVGRSDLNMVTTEIKSGIHDALAELSDDWRDKVGDDDDGQ